VQALWWFLSCILFALLLPWIYFALSVNNSPDGFAFVHLYVSMLTCFFVTCNALLLLCLLFLLMCRGVSQVIVYYSIPVDALSFTLIAWNGVGVGMVGLLARADSPSNLNRAALIAIALSVVRQQITHGGHARTVPVDTDQWTFLWFAASV